MPKSAPTKKRAKDVIDFIEEHCFIPEGRLVGQKVKLLPWQKDIIRRIYDNPAGTRRAIVSFGRKNAKTTLSAFLLLAHLCGPVSKQNSSLYSAAQSRDQAGILFGLAAKIVRMSPELRASVIVRDTAKELVCRDRGTIYKALSAEASTAYGLSPALIAGAGTAFEALRCPRDGDRSARTAAVDHHLDAGADRCRSAFGAD
jgi:phage terminase large subunit-like protein